MSNILIVDDEQSYRQLLSLVFEGDGHLIRTAANGREALELLQAEPADIVISDVRMPDMDGIAFYRRLQSIELPRRPRLIVMAGDTSNAGIEDFLRQHHLPVLRKPFTWQELLAALEPPS